MLQHWNGIIPRRACPASAPPHQQLFSPKGIRSFFNTHRRDYRLTSQRVLRLGR